MATKKEPPTPLPCLCGAAPGVCKTRGGGYVIDYVSVDCRRMPLIKRPKLSEAVDAWNEEVQNRGKAGKRH